jgi:hypothetical protein
MSKLMQEVAQWDKELAEQEKSENKLKEGYRL